jgi:hypothetical protein
MPMFTGMLYVRFGMRVLALDYIHLFGAETSVPGCIHTDCKKLVTRKEKSRCSNMVPCAIGSISWSYTSHPAPAGCGLDFIVRERSVVEGLNMPLHSAPRRYRTSVRVSFDALNVLPLLPQFHSRNRIILKFTIMCLVGTSTGLLLLSKLLPKGFLGVDLLTRTGWDSWVSRSSSVQETPSDFTTRTWVCRATFAGWFSLSTSTTSR